MLDELRMLLMSDSGSSIRILGCSAMFRLIFTYVLPLRPFRPTFHRLTIPGLPLRPQPGLVQILR